MSGSSESPRLRTAQFLADFLDFTVVMSRSVVHPLGYTGGRYVQPLGYTGGPSRGKCTPPTLPHTVVGGRVPLAHRSGSWLLPSLFSS